MHAQISRASTGRSEGERDFQTLNELMEFIRENGESIIIETTRDNWSVTIYDDYIE